MSHSFRPFRALLLAAGYGTRLRPLTLNLPKCLIPIGGIPILGRWLHQLESAGCDAVVVNTHYMADKVEKYIISHQQQDLPIIIKNEPTLLGTAGSLLENINFFKGYTGLLIHSDNYYTDNINSFLSDHHSRPEQCELTMLTFDTISPSSCGIVEQSPDGILTSFHEKSLLSKGTIANAAIYAFDNCFLESISRLQPRPQDFSLDIIPKMLNRTYVSHTHMPFLDIGTLSSLRHARSISRQFAKS